MTGKALLPLALLAALACASGPSAPTRVGPTGVAGPRAPEPWQDVEAAPSGPAIRFASERPVTLTSLASETVVADPIAWTEMKITLENPGKTPAEGRLQLALPGSTFAARALGEGGKVLALDERRAPTGHGERAFWTAPITIAPGQSATLVVQHAGALAGPNRSLAIRLSGIGPVDKATIRVHDRQGSAPLVDESFEQREPPDFVVRSLAASSAQGGGVSFERALGADAAPAPAPASLVFLIDTSVTRARDLGAQLRLLHTLAEALPAESRLVVAAYDEAVAPLYDGRASELPASLPRDLAQRGALGSSNALPALEWAIDQARKDNGRIVIVSDGIDRRAASDPAELGAALRARLKGARPRIDVLAPSGAQSSAVQRVLASEVAPRRGRVLPLHDGGVLKAILSGDAAAPVAPPPAGVVGAWPSAPELAAPGADVIVASRSSAVAAGPAQGIPEWVTAPLAREFPRYERAYDRYGAIEGAARPFLPASYDREEVDPLGALKERTRPAPDPQPTITVAKPSPPAAPSPTTSVEVDSGKGSLPPDAILTIIRRNFGRFRGCYQETLRRVPTTAGKIVIRFEIHPSGVVSHARSVSSEVTSPELVACVVRSFEALSFPASDRDPISVTYPLVLSKGDGSQPDPAKPLSVATRGAVPLPLPRPHVPSITAPSPPKEPWSGEAKVVYEAIGRGAFATATQEARRIVRERPEDGGAYLLLADALLAEGDKPAATRAALSLVELGPDDAGAHRLAAGRLMSTGNDADRGRAEEVLKRAIELKPEQPSSLHMLAGLRAQRGDLEGALRLLDVALERTADPARYPGARELVRFDLGLIAAALAAREPTRRIGLARWVADVGVEIEARPALRVAVSWEGDDSDLNLVVRDRGLSSTAKTTPVLASGGRMLGDVQQGRGPEGFALSAAVAGRSYPYTLAVALPRAGSQRVAGSAHILELDAQGRLAFDTRTFAIDVVGSEGSIGTLEGPLAR